MAKRNIKKIVSILAAVTVVTSQLVFSAPMASAVAFNGPVYIEAASINYGNLSAASRTESFDSMSGTFQVSFDMTVEEDSNIADNGFTLTFNQSGATSKANGVLRLGAYSTSTKAYAVEWYQGNSSTSVDRLGNIQVGKKYTYQIAFSEVGTGEGAKAAITITGEDGSTVANGIQVSCRSYTNDNTAKSYILNEAVTTVTARDTETPAYVNIDSFGILKPADVSDVNVTVDKATVAVETTNEDGTVSTEYKDENEILLEAENNPAFYVPSSGTSYSLTNDSDYEIEYSLKDDIDGISINGDKLVIQSTAPEGKTEIALHAAVKGSAAYAEMKLVIDKVAATGEDIVSDYFDTLSIADADGKSVSANNGTLTTTKDLVLAAGDDYVDIAWKCFAQNDKNEWEDSDVIDVATGKYTITEGFDGKAKIVATITSKADSSVSKEKTFYVNISNPEEQLKLDTEELESYMEDYEEVTKSFELPKKGSYGSVITWTSSNPSVISTKGNVTRTTSDKTVTLTATLENGGQSEELEFKITVEKKATSSGGGSSSSGSSGNRTVTSYRNNTPAVTTNHVVTTPTSINNTPVNNTPVNNNTPTQQSAPLPKFSDLGSVAWASDAINALADKGIINGKADNTFAPDDEITRAEFAKILINALGLADANAAADSFTDVDKSAWYYNSVASAFAKGIITGYDNGTFGVGDAVSRQDMAVLIYRAAKAANITLPETSAAVTFTDSDAIDDYAKEAVTALQKANIINGVSADEFAPKATASRAAAAKMIYGIYNLK